ncbi:MULTISPECIES: hypothetical protein [unclassified Shinella]|uniref:hypothetical protein n=1 Tax=unclassified Shinella TaxID=2643062 RepID=UPI001FDA0F79|nr:MULTISPECIES: hypothetical protein [unclassified Shinella]
MPWYRFPKRMLAWRAAGYCLRELFGDVLGGIRDEFEAREIADAEEMRDITPAGRAAPPKPPAPPAPPTSKTIEAAPTPEPETEEHQSEPDFDLGSFLEELGTSLATAKDSASAAEIWNDYDAPAILESNGHADMIDAAYAMRDRTYAKLEPYNGGLSQWRRRLQRTRPSTSSATATALSAKWKWIAR